MGRKRNERADRGERTNSPSENRNSDNRNMESESLGSNNGMEAGRAERIRGPGVESDRQAGDEGVDDSAMSRTHRDDMSGTPAHGDRLRGRESARQRTESQRSMRTQQRSNDERFDDASGFSGQGSQKEGSSEEAEGTGYTEESNTDRSSRE